MDKEEYFTMLKSCRLCPRQCKVDRLEGQTGFCGAVGMKAEVSRAALHFWEEPCISGSQGSGTVFFNHCNLKCLYCQNYRISRGDSSGIEITVERLSEIFIELQELGAHNINLVTPTPYVCHIAAAIDFSRGSGLRLPVVYNCGGYEEAYVMDMLKGKIQIYLTDFKYWNRDLAAEYSQAYNYTARAIKALDAMVVNTGTPALNDDGLMQKGVIVRHLVLPGAWEDSIKIIGFLHRKYGNNIYISIMNQYTPPERCVLPDMLKKKTEMNEYEKVLEYAEDIGVEYGFIQHGGTGCESFVPDFDGTGVLKRKDFMV